MYLDYNSTTPIDHRVFEHMQTYLTQEYGNPSSAHQYGQRSRLAIAKARSQVAALVGVEPQQLIFTSGGTEANNLAIKGYLSNFSAAAAAYSAVEHSSVLSVMKALPPPWRAIELPVDNNGVLVPLQTDSLPHDLKLISVMLANNENGVIQPVQTIGDFAQSKGIAVHCDAVQALGKIPVDFAQLGVQLMSLSAHKIYGPKGVGALIFEPGIKLDPQLLGGGHENGYRSGTENLAGIVGFGLAAELAQQELQARTKKLIELRDYLQAGLKQIPGVVIFAEQAARVANTLQIACAGADGAHLLQQLDQQNIAVSSGSACSSGKTQASHVLQAMGVEADLARSAIRVSLGKETRRSELDSFLHTLKTLLT